MHSYMIHTYTHTLIWLLYGYKFKSSVDPSSWKQPLEPHFHNIKWQQSIKHPIIPSF